ncbi:MAG: 1-phosphofructokinase family hexose kinase [Bacillota bacterium]
MIVTVGFNLGIESKYTVESLGRSAGAGGPIPALATEHGAFGGAIAATRVAVELGEETIVTGIAGGMTGKWLCEILTKDRITHDFWQIDENTPQNLIIVDQETQCSYRINQHGLNLDPGVASAVVDGVSDKIRSLSETGGVTIFSGALPSGLTTDLYSGLIRKVAQHRATTVLNTEGVNLREMQSARPYLLVVSRAKLEAWLGMQNCALDQLLEGVIQLSLAGSEIVALSLGTDGAVVAWGKDVYLAQPPNVNAANYEGCEDTLTAGFAVGLARRWGAQETIRTAMAAVIANEIAPKPGRLRLLDVEALWEQVQVSRI